MYVDGNNKLVIKKAMDLTTAMEMFYPDHDKYKNDSPFVLHWRIGTHGIKSIDNVHPFSITEREAVVHNGIIKIDIPAGDSRSDTRVFVDEILKRLPEGWQAHAAMRELVRSYIGYSKLAFLDTDRKVNIINSSMGTWNDERWFSNNTFSETRWGNSNAGGLKPADNQKSNKFVPRRKKSCKSQKLSDGDDSYMVMDNVMYRLRSPGVWEPVPDEEDDDDAALQQWLFENSSYSKEKKTLEQELAQDKDLENITKDGYAKYRENGVCFYCNESVLTGGENECIITANEWHETTICYSCYMLLEDEAVKEGTTSVLVAHEDMVGMIHSECKTWASEECEGCFDKDIPCIHLAYSGDFIDDYNLELCCQTKFQKGMYETLMAVLDSALEETEEETKEKVKINA